jgi:hypothetical protein
MLSSIKEKILGAAPMRSNARVSRADSLVNGPSQFDYASVPTSVAKFLKGQATRIRQYTGKTIVQIGGDLVSAKHYLSHGQFLRWVENEVGIPARTAQAYMQAAQWASEHRATAAVLPPSLLYILSSPSTPREFSEAVERRVEAGEHISPTSVRAELKAMRAARQTDNAGECTIGCPAPPNATNQDDTMTRIDFALGEVVEVLVNTLSTAEFSRVCAILTSNDVLGQPDLPGKIRRAFRCAQAADIPTNGDLRMVAQKRNRRAFGHADPGHHRHHNEIARLDQPC